jgi:hypothetical protein
MRTLILTGAILGICRYGDVPASNSAAAAEPSEKQVTLSELDFAHPDLHRKWLGIDKAAREIAGDDWNVTPWHVRPPLQSAGRRDISYFASWCSRNDKPCSNCGWDDRPVHEITLIANPYPQGANNVARLFVSAKRFPVKGWGTQILFYSYRPYMKDSPGAEHFDITFYHDEFKQSEFGPVFSIPGRSSSLKKKFVAPKGGQGNVLGAKPEDAGKAEYQFWVTDSRNERDGDYERFLRSPEALRDEALAAIDALEKVARADVKSGEAVYKVVDFTREMTVIRKTRGGPVESPPVPAEFKKPIPKRYTLSDEQKDEVLRDWHAQFDRRRQLIKKHYRELHAAAEATFPVLKATSKP